MKTKKSSLQERFDSLSPFEKSRWAEHYEWYRRNVDDDWAYDDGYGEQNWTFYNVGERSHLFDEDIDDA